MRQKDIVVGAEYAYRDLRDVRRVTALETGVHSVSRTPGWSPQGDVYRSSSRRDGIKVLMHYENGDSPTEELVATRDILDRWDTWYKAHTAAVLAAEERSAHRQQVVNKLNRVTGASIRLRTSHSPPATTFSANWHDLEMILHKLEELAAER